MPRTTTTPKPSRPMCTASTAVRASCPVPFADQRGETGRARGDVLGGFVGQTAGMGSPITALSVSMAAPYDYEIRDRAKVGFAVHPQRHPRSPEYSTTAWRYRVVPAPTNRSALPADVMRPELIKEAIAARAKTLAFGGRGADPSQPPGEKGEAFNASVLGG